MQYDPYGEVLTSTLPVTPVLSGVEGLTERLFTGQRFDNSSGLYYYNARYYDPHLGRFIQSDTLVPDPLSPQAWNRFSYCGNNPTSYVDPSGHFIIAAPLLIFGALAFTGAFIGGAAYMSSHPGENYALSPGFYFSVLGGEALGATFGMLAVPEVAMTVKTAILFSHMSTYLGDVGYNRFVEHRTGLAALAPRSSWQTYLGNAVGSVIAGELAAAKLMSPFRAAALGGGIGSLTGQSLEVVGGEPFYPVGFGWNIIVDAAVSGAAAGVADWLFQIGKPKLLNPTGWRSLVEVRPGVWTAQPEPSPSWQDFWEAEIGIWVGWAVDVARRRGWI